jgi:hypothetical protein
MAARVFKTILNQDERTGRLAEFFRGIVEGDYQVEEVKEKLARKKDFNLFNAFKMIDLDKSGVLNRSNFEEALFRFNQKTSMDFSPLVARYCSEPGLIKFSEFGHLVAPADSSLARKLHCKQPD